MNLEGFKNTILKKKEQLGFLTIDVLNKLVPFVASPIIIDTYGSNYFGSFINTTLIFNLFLYIVGGGLQSKVLVDMSKSCAAYTSILNSSIICILMVILFGVLLNSIRLGFIDESFGIDTKSINKLLLSSFFGSILFLINSKNQYEHKLFRYGLIQIIPPSGMIILTITTGDINSSYLFSYGLAFLISILIMSCKDLKANEISINKNIMLESLLFYLGQQPHLVSTWFKLSIDRFVLSALVSLSVSARYSVILQVAMTMSVAMVSLNKYWTPKALRALNQDQDIAFMKKSFIKNAFMIYLLVLTIGFIYIATAFDHTYFSFLYLLPIVAGAYLLQGYYLTESVHVFQTGKTYKLILPSIISTASHIVLSLILIPKYQAVGAAVSLLTSWLLLYLFTKITVDISV